MEKDNEHERQDSDCNTASCYLRKIMKTEYEIIQEAMECEGLTIHQMSDWCGEMRLLLEEFIQDVNNAMENCERITGTELIENLLKAKDQWGVMPYRSVYEDESGVIKLQK